MTRAVLFDLDGVLVDSREVWLAVVNATAARLGAPQITRARLEAIFGQGVEADVDTLFPGATVEAVRSAYDEVMPGRLDRIVANPEARAILEALGARGVGRAVVTNTQTGLAEAIVENAGLADAIDAVAAVGDGLREKPAPDLLLHALRRLEVAPADAVLVGDTDYDARAADAAGTRFIRYVFGEDGSLAARLAAHGVE